MFSGEKATWLGRSGRVCIKTGQVNATHDIYPSEGCNAHPPTLLLRVRTKLNSEMIAVTWPWAPRTGVQEHMHI